MIISICIHILSTCCSTYLSLSPICFIDSNLKFLMSSRLVSLTRHLNMATPADSSQSVYVTIIRLPTPVSWKTYVPRTWHDYFEVITLTTHKLFNFAIAVASHHKDHEPGCLSWVASKSLDSPKLFQGASEEDAQDGEMMIYQEFALRNLIYVIYARGLTLTWLQVEESWGLERPWQDWMGGRLEG